MTNKEALNYIAMAPKTSNNQVRKANLKSFIVKYSSAKIYNNLSRSWH